MLDLTYQINAHDSLTFTGTESFRRYLHNTLYCLQPYYLGRSGAFTSMCSRPGFRPAAPTVSPLWISGMGSRVPGIQTIQAFANYQLGPHMTVSGWVGPEYTATKNLVPILCTPYGLLYRGSRTTVVGHCLRREFWLERAAQCGHGRLLRNRFPTVAFCWESCSCTV